MKIVIKYFIFTSLLLTLSSCVLFPTVFSYDITLVDEKGKPVKDAYLIQETYSSLFSWGKTKTKVIPFGQSNHLEYRYWEIMCLFFAWSGPSKAYLYKIGCLPVSCSIPTGLFATKETKVILSPEYQLYTCKAQGGDGYNTNDWMISTTKKDKCISRGGRLTPNCIFWNDPVLTLGGGWSDYELQESMKKYPEKPVAILFEDYVSAHKLTSQERKKHWIRVPATGYVTGTYVWDLLNLDENVEVYRYSRYDAKKEESLNFGIVPISDSSISLKKAKKSQTPKFNAKKASP